MIREAPAMTVRQNLGELLNEVQYRNGRVLISTAGKPVAALVGVALYERIRELDEELRAVRVVLGTNVILSLQTLLQSDAEVPVSGDGDLLALASRYRIESPAVFARRL